MIAICTANGGTANASTVRITRADGSDGLVTQIAINDAQGVSHNVFDHSSSMAVSVSPDQADGSSSQRGGAVYSNTVMASATGGTPPYAHQWTTDPGFVASYPTSASTSFRGTPPALQGEISGTATDTITDSSNPPIVKTVTVQVDLVRDSSLG